jgi:hypothetical protein
MEARRPQLSWRAYEFPRLLFWNVRSLYCRQRTWPGLDAHQRPGEYGERID